MTDVREITRSPRTLARFAMSCSVIPSAKYSCSGPLDRFSSGSTATDRMWRKSSVVDERPNRLAIVHTATATRAATNDAATHRHPWPRIVPSGRDACLLA
jgi:hypothetical protein